MTFANDHDLGHGVTYSKTGRMGTEAWTGIMIQHHDCPVLGDHCFAGLQFDVPENEDMKEAKWTVRQWDPLTLHPSIHRVECGLHGFIRDGRWVPA